MTALQADREYRTGDFNRHVTIIKIRSFLFCSFLYIKIYNNMAIKIACTSSRSACKAVITGSFGKLIFSEIHPVHSTLFN